VSCFYFVFFLVCLACEMWILHFAVRCLTCNLFHRRSSRESFSKLKPIGSVMVAFVALLQDQQEQHSDNTRYSVRSGDEDAKSFS
jgi:hypothetical protein